MGSYHIAFHMEAQRKQRVIERKQDALENLAKTKAADERLQTREGTRAGTRAATSNPQRPQYPRDFKVPPRSRLIPPKPEPTHQWRDLQNNHLHHDARLMDRPYKHEANRSIDRAYWERTR